MATATYPPAPEIYRLYANDAPQPPPPPPAPITGDFQLFGQIFTTEDGLPGLPPGMPKLYKDIEEGADLGAELRRLNKETLFKFMDVVDSLTRSPKEQPPKMEALLALLHNVHHLLSAIRPHQARTALEELLTEQLARKEAVLAKLRKRTSKAKTALQQSRDEIQRLGGIHKSEDDGGLGQCSYDDFRREVGGTETAGKLARHDSCMNTLHSQIQQEFGRAPSGHHDSFSGMLDAVLQLEMVSEGMELNFDLAQL